MVRRSLVVLREHAQPEALPRPVRIPLVHRTLTEPPADRGDGGRGAGRAAFLPASHRAVEWSTRGLDPTHRLPRAGVVTKTCPARGCPRTAARSPCTVGPPARGSGGLTPPHASASCSAVSSVAGGLSSTGTEKSRTAWNARRKESRRLVVHGPPVGGICRSSPTSPGGRPSTPRVVEGLVVASRSCRRSRTGGLRLVPPTVMLRPTGVRALTSSDLTGSPAYFQRPARRDAIPRR